MVGSSLFATVDMEQASFVINQINAFCAEYWWGAAVIGFIYALYAGYTNRKTARRNKESLDAAVADAKYRAKREGAEEAKLALAKKQQEEEAKEEKPLTPEQRVQKVVKTALDFGHEKWDWDAAKSKLQCRMPGFEKLFAVLTEGAQDKPNEKVNVQVHIDKEDVSAVIGNAIIGNAIALLKSKWAALHAEKLMTLAGSVGDGLFASTTVNNPTPAPAPSNVVNVPLSSVDAVYGSKMFNNLLALLNIHGRWAPLVNQDCNYFTDAQAVTFKVLGPTECEIWVGGHSVTWLFNKDQQLALAKACYNRATNDSARRTHLDSAAALLEKTYTARG